MKKTVPAAGVILGSVLLLLLCARDAAALEKDEILVVYNNDFAGSKKLADYYVRKRGIPAEHVLGITSLQAERISREVYLSTIQKPIKQWIDENGKYDRIKCILLMRGVPLAVNRIIDVKTRDALWKAEAALRPVAREKKELDAEKKRLEEEARKNPAQAAAWDKKMQALEAKIAEVDIRLKPLKEKRDGARKARNEAVSDTNASVDSELAVMYVTDNPLKRWLRNMLNHRTWKRPNRDRMPRTFMVCRLDAASDALVKRIIDDSIEVEKKGLEGVAYFDARGKRMAPRGKISYYTVYDVLIHRGAATVEKTGMKTVLDDKRAVFAPDTCPDAALYCGWYSLVKYVPAFKWVKGSVGFHVASGEATSLRSEKTQAWCKRMIDDGVAATFGPVSEPFLQSFPDPSHFFAFLLTGRYTVAEAFWYSKPMNSWMLTLIADPLYTPFRKNPKMTIAEMKEALRKKPIRPPTRPAQETSRSPRRSCPGNVRPPVPSGKSAVRGWTCPVRS